MWTPETLELRCADAWPAVIEEKVGDWRLRAAADRPPGSRPREDQVRASSDTQAGDDRNAASAVPFTARANSTLAVGDPGLPVAEALKTVCEFAHSHRNPPVVQAIEDSETEREIAGAGWVPHSGHAAGHVVSVLTGALGDGAPEVTLSSSPSPGWWDLTVGTTHPSPAQRHVLTTGEVGFGTIEAGDVTAGALRAAVAGDILLVARLAVRPQYRRQGLAKALMAACGPWAAERGAKTCVLQVAIGNEPALALYRALGFAEHHRYRYWVR
ncbi:GNAT family N-acetyltransferase [Amycolatopsis pigmentata]|uniref:GNAT family N-acetyltransferase n=1 Tax=Amycolatopsis pigmentata TaxID=450801 RepID=A0ABW5G469_9PSEU